MPDPVDIIAEVAQHIGEGRVRTIAHAADRRPGARHESGQTRARPITVPVGKQTLGRVLNVIGQPVDDMGP